MTGPSPPGVKSLVKRKVLGMFLGAQSAKICGIPRISTIFMEVCGNMRIPSKIAFLCENYDVAVKAPPETAQGLTFH